MVYDQLRLGREKGGLSQGELAAQMQVLGVNLGQQMVSRIKRDERVVTDYELACFCKILKVPEAELLEDCFKTSNG